MDLEALIHDTMQNTAIRAHSLRRLVDLGDTNARDRAVAVMLVLFLDLKSSFCFAVFIE